jgi:hypothetical protein
MWCPASACVDWKICEGTVHWIPDFARYNHINDGSAVKERDRSSSFYTELNGESWIRWQRAAIFNGIVVQKRRHISSPSSKKKTYPARMTNQHVIWCICPECLDYEVAINLSLICERLILLSRCVMRWMHNTLANFIHVRLKTCGQKH